MKLSDELAGPGDTLIDGTLHRVALGEERRAWMLVAEIQSIMGPVLVCKTARQFAEAQSRTRLPLLWSNVLRSVRQAEAGSFEYVTAARP